jgi:hypothetical protein
LSRIVLLKCPIDLSREAVRGEKQQHLYLSGAQHAAELIEPDPIVLVTSDSKVVIDVLSRYKNPVLDGELEDRSHLIFCAVLHPRAEPHVDRSDGFSVLARESRMSFGNQLVDFPTCLLIASKALRNDLGAFSRLSVPWQAGYNDRQHQGTEQG